MEQHAHEAVTYPEQSSEQRGTVVAASAAPPDPSTASVAAQGTGAAARQPPFGIFGRAVCGLDRLLRDHKGVYEFSDHPACLLRVAIIPAGESAILSDGTRIAPHERLADLHFWNERVPAIPAGGPNLAWAVRAQRRLELSLVELAKYLEARPELHDVRAIRGDAAFITRLGQDRLGHLAGLFGFERDADVGARPDRRRWIQQFCADLMVLALVWTFNRRALQRGGNRVVRPQRERLWMSRQALLGRYGSDRLTARRSSLGLPTGASERDGALTRSVRPGEQAAHRFGLDLPE